MRDFLRDLGYGWRAMRRAPGATAVAVVALALGIGANTAVFSVVHAILWRPFPGYRAPERLVQICGTSKNIPCHAIFYADVVDLRKACRSFTGMAAAMPGGAALTTTDATDPERVTAWRVNAGFFPMIGTPFAAGRGFTAEEDTPNGPRAAVLSWALWQRRFAGDPRAVGSVIRLDGETYAVVGVLPREFQLAGRPVDLFRPMELAGARDERTMRPTTMLYARLRDGVSLAQAQEDLAAAGRRIGEQFPGSLAKMPRVWGLREFVTRNVRASLMVLMGAVAFVLLIACANVANILLARCGARRREMAVRTALGAGRARLLRQLLSESLLLAGAGAAAGLVLAHWMVQALTKLAGEGVPLLESARIDGAALAFTLGAAVLTTLIFGLAPAAITARGDAPYEALREGERGGEGPRAGHFRSALVVGETALALVLVAGAGLLIRNFARLQAVDPGFHPSGVLTATLGLAGYENAERRVLFLRQLTARLEAMPGVKAAGVTSLLPMSGANTGTGIYPEGWPPPRPGEYVPVWYRTANAGYFRAMEIPLKSGRLFTEQDTPAAPPVVVVSETLARRYWPGEPAVGKRFTYVGTAASQAGRAPQWVTVVGVVGDLRYEGPAKTPLAEMYYPYTQQSFGGPLLAPLVAVKVTSDAARFGPALRAAVRGLDAGVTVSQERTMDRIVAQALATERLSTSVLGAFAGIALVLAAAGIYAVMAFTVARRTREIGVRMALGAEPRAVLAMVLRGALALALAGVGLGLTGAAALTRVMASMLYGVSATDPAIFAAVVTLVLAVSALAAYVPARRAARVDPMVALRYE